MENKKTNEHWIRDILLIPIIVGIVIAILSYGLPKFLERGKQITYEIEGPITYIDSNSQEIGNIQIKVNDKEISSIFLYRISIKNNGDLPIKDLPIRFVFDSINQDFEIIAVNHTTNPSYEFGEIIEERIGNNSIRFTYALINPKDEDVVTLVVNKSPSLDVFAKAEGLRVKRIENKFWSQLDNLSAAMSVIGFLISVLTIGIKKFTDKFYYERNIKK